MNAKRAQQLLDNAQAAQQAFWLALADLEEELGCEIDGTEDLSLAKLELLQPLLTLGDGTKPKEEVN